MDKKLKPDATEYMGFPLLDELPDGWILEENAGSPLYGYSFCRSTKSRFDPAYKSALVKIMNEMPRYRMPRYRITRYEHQPFDGFDPVFCEHCGRQIQHLYGLADTQTEGFLYPVGSGCIYQLAGKSVAQINLENDEYTAQLEADEEKEAKAKKSREWQIVNADILAGLEKLSNGSEHYVPNAESMLENVVKWGTLTEKQLGYAKRMIENAERYCGRQAYFATMHWVYFMECELRLGRYDGQFLKDISSRDQFGITIKQAEAVRKVAQKYRRQISEKPREFELWHMAEKHLVLPPE